MKIKPLLSSIFKEIKQMFIGKRLFISVLLFSSMLLIFPAGAFLDSTKFEECGLSAARFAKNNTTNGDYLALSITSKDSSKMPTGFFETHELNGIFRGNNFNFATTVNCNKTQNISIPELSSDINFSILYANTFSNRVYEDHFRHEYFPLELMFKGDHTVDQDDYSFCYISNSQADVLLEKLTLEKTTENYEKLLRSNIDIEYDGFSCNYSIANIYLEKNTFYGGLRSTMGDFVVTYSKHPESFKQTYSYFLNAYPFQNTYLMERIASIYSSNKYSLELNNFNIKNNFDYTKVTNFFTIKNSNNQNIFSILLIITAYILFLVPLLLLFIKKITISFVHIFSYPALNIFIHLIFRIIYLSTNSIYLFSYFSTISFFIMNVVLVLYLVILFIFFRRRHYYDQNIESAAQ